MKYSTSSIKFGILFSLISALLFSSKAIFVKQAYEAFSDLDAITLMTIRMSTALPFFILICWIFRSKNNLNIKDWFFLICVGLLGYYISSWFDFYGLMYISASLERIILFLYPTLTVLASSLIFKNKLNLKIIIALLLSYGGTILVMLEEQKNLLDQQNFWLGASLVFASAITFACYLLLTPSLITKFGSWRLTGWSLSAACIGTLFHFFLTKPNPILVLTELPISIFWYGLYLGVFVTVIPTILMILSIESLGASRSAMISSISPILTILLAVIFLGEYLNYIQWIGCVLNIAGVLLISLGRHKMS